MSGPKLGLKAGVFETVSIVSQYIQNFPELFILLQDFVPGEKMEKVGALEILEDQQFG